MVYSMELVFSMDGPPLFSHTWNPTRDPVQGDKRRNFGIEPGSPGPSKANVLGHWPLKLNLTSGCT